MDSQTELVDHEIELLTWKHWFLGKIMSPSRLQEHCALDNGRHQQHISQNDHVIPDPLGVFSSLPAEIFDAILEELDLQSLTVCRAASWAFRDAIDNFTPYKSIITHCPDTMRALLCTYSAPHYTARQIYSALCSPVCDECKQQFGPLLDLLSGRRCCMPCVLSSPNLLTFGKWRLKYLVDKLRAEGILNEANIDRDPLTLQSLPGKYFAPQERIQISNYYTYTMTELQSRGRYARRSSRPKQPKQLPKSFLDDDEDVPQTAPHSGWSSRRNSGVSRNTSGGNAVPSTFLDDDEQDDEKLWFQRSGARHTRGTSWRSSMDAGKSFFADLISASTSGATTPKEEIPQPMFTTAAEEPKPAKPRERSQSIARSRSRYRKAPPKIQTKTAELPPVIPSITPTSVHPPPSAVAAIRSPSNPPLTKLSKDPIPLDVYRQYVTQMQPSATVTKQSSAESIGSSPKTAGSDTTSSSDAFDAARVLPPPPPYRKRQDSHNAPGSLKVMVVLSKRSREPYKFEHNTTVGELLDWACKRDAMTLRGAAILVERLPGFGFERALHESELLATVVDAMECRKEEATLYLDVDLVKSQNLRSIAASTDKAPPARLVANFYYAKGEDANSKIRSKRYFCLDDAKLTMSRMSSRAKSEKSSHVCNIMEYGIYTVGQYGKKRDFDTPSKCQYIIIMKALSSKQMFVDQSRFFHFLATDSQEQYFEWVKSLNEWRSFLYQVKERTKVAESQLIAKLEQGGVSSPEISETKLARLLTESKLTQATKKNDGVLSPGVMSPTTLSPKGGLGNGALNGSMNPAAYQTFSDTSSNRGGAAPIPGPDEFLSTGLLGKMYDRKVEMKNLETAPTMRVDRMGGQLIHGAGSRIEEAAGMYASTPKTPIYERAGAEERGRQGHRKDNEMTFYRDQTTSPPSRLQKVSSNGMPPPNMATSPAGLIQPKPLLDFGNEEDEMFKYKKKITGHGVEVDRNAGPLIHHATEPVNPNAITRSISTRLGRNAAASQAGSRARSATLKSGSKQRYEPEQPTFETTGLLASVPTQPQYTGHGIATGRHGAGKPLLNMSLNSNFVPGSLLEKHERVKEGGPTYKKTVSREVC
ncbi:hypothetical protein H072_5930 [Dactylellina haptotyla CBS 200.50]|uniref:F-box domain-containing protein n=1 Tax=Dactylellina haptotyla (strain CBS 200.50) TaxID=1284197 RepID=S8BLH5_DACHA|nr:hypothetical protein H072_5930 [Dactylellina haptotyla CBS 200.50]